MHIRHVRLAAEAWRMTPRMMQTEATPRPAFRPQRSTIGPTIGPPKMHPALMIAELRPVRSLLSLKSDLHCQKRHLSSGIG